MNNEMIDKIKKCLIASYDLDIINQEEMYVLWNYITNLQKYYNDNVNKYEELLVKYSNLQDKIDKAIEFINEYCIDDEFYINLSYKEKGIIEVKKILSGDDSDE